MYFPLKFCETFIRKGLPESKWTHLKLIEKTQSVTKHMQCISQLVILYL